MEKSASEKFSPSMIILEKLAAGPLSSNATAVHQGLLGGFERYAKRVLLHPRYPWVIRWFLIGFLVALTYSAFFGPNDARLNFATVMSWIVWWPLLQLVIYCSGGYGVGFARWALYLSLSIRRLV